jgi:acetyl esterase/lipase
VSGQQQGPLLDVPYGPAPQQCLDLYLPERPAHDAFILLVHGGGWSVGDKEQYAIVGERLAHEGWVVAITNYRLSPAVQHPTHVEDVARAVAWCHAHAAHYGADPERLCILGHSSGAHLAALVALDPAYLAAHGLPTSTIRRVMGLAGVAYDLDESYAVGMAAPFFGPVFGEDSTRWHQAAPVRYVTPSAPPFLLVHGLSDTEAPPSSTEAMAEALRAVGVEARLALLPGEGHISVVFAAAPLVLDFVHAPWPERAAVAGRSGAS